MAVDAGYLQYPNRREGMDHGRYDFSVLQKRKAISWPKQKSIALNIVVCQQVFPLDQKGNPFKTPGGMSTTYPDLRHASLRDYGHRIGIYRVLDALDQNHFSASFAVSSDLTQLAPQLVRELTDRGEIIAHGANMDQLHFEGLSAEEENERIKNCLNAWSELGAQTPSGWLSPARNQSTRTPDLLKTAGIRYCLDWVNDELPYQQHTSHGPLWALPTSLEIEDRFVIMHNLHSEQSWYEQLCDAYDFLHAEAQRSQSGRMLSICLHPWLIGHSHRIIWLERALAHIAARGDYWNANASEIIQHMELPP
jgi:allantoinase